MISRRSRAAGSDTEPDSELLRRASDNPAQHAAQRAGYRAIRGGQPDPQLQDGRLPKKLLDAVRNPDLRSQRDRLAIAGLAEPVDYRR